jgi:hypothetical protein
VDRATAGAGAADRRVAAAQRRARGLELAAGTAAVTGPSMSVTLDDAPRSADRVLPEGATPTTCVVHQQDIQGVVNALWAGGAEAMQIMDQRVIATSAVRCVGNTLILQGRVYSPPYTVTAIGDPERLAQALEDAPAVQDYRYYVDAFGSATRPTPRPGPGCRRTTGRWTCSTPGPPADAHPRPWRRRAPHHRRPRAAAVRGLPARVDQRRGAPADRRRGGRRAGRLAATADHDPRHARSPR